MDADLLSMLMGGGSPEALQRRQAALLQGQKQFQDVTTAAANRAQNYDILNFAAQNSNNAGLAKSVGALQAAQAARNAPQKLDKGVFVPETGEYVESPGVADEKEADRQQRMLSAAATLQARTDAANSAADARRYAADQAYQGRVLARSLGGQMTEYQRQALELRQQAAEDKKSDTTDKNVVKFSNTLEKAGVPEFESALGQVEGTLSKYPKGDIPGFGAATNLLPNALISGEGKNNRLDMAQAANILLKIRSGAAVTDQEARRFLTEVGQGVGMSADQLRRGWANVRNSFDAKKSGIVAGVGDDVLNAYNAGNPTITLKRGGKAPAVPAVGTVQDGHVFLGGDPADPKSWKAQ